jgi:hypothetical protein
MTEHELSKPDSQFKPGLADLDRVVLSEFSQSLLDHAVSQSGGDRGFRARKMAEARDLVALSQIAPRMVLVHLDLREALRAAIQLKVRVAVRNGPDAPVEIKDTALLGLVYPEEAMRTALPGYGFIQVVGPSNCWSASISRDAVQALCLGTSMPAGVRCKNLVVMAYDALTMQSVQFDTLDPAGVMNAEAATWWQENIDRIPLSHSPFLSDPNNE